MELSVLKIDGTESGKKVVLNDEIFGITPNDHAIYLDVKQFLANQRHGNAKTKDRSEVAYSTKKLIRQKGSGGARHGSLKANIYVGGGRVFGPKPHFYGFKLNKKLKQLARLCPFLQGSGECNRCCRAVHNGRAKDKGVYRYP